MQKINRLVKKLNLHWVILTLSLLLTLFAWYFTKQKTEEQTTEAFNLEAKKVVTTVQQRMQQYTDALWSAAAHITVIKNKLDYHSWAEYTKQLDITKKYPGINGIGVIYDIRRDAANQFVAQQRMLRSDFNIHPEHTGKRLLPITYIEPEASNKEAVGLDMAHEINRYTAAIKTEMTGKAQITGPIILVQDAKRTPGFLLFVPLYAKGTEKKFIGLVYAPFIMSKLMQGSFQQHHAGVSIKIRDESQVIFDEQNESKSNKPLFQTNISEPMYGRIWTFEVDSTAYFEKNNVSQEPHYILGFGLFINFLLLILFISLARSKKKAVEYAERITSDLNEKTTELDKLAYYDELTGLLNRNGFFQTLEQRLKSAKQNTNLLAICIIDIDNFKQINDSRGYEAGDEILKFLAIAFKSLKKSNTIARLGADEFAVIIDSKASEEEILEEVCHYQKITNTSQFLTKTSLPATLSVGIAIYPSAGKTAKSLYISADIASNAAKEAGRNRSVIFNESLSQKVKRHHEIDFAIRKALKNEELTVVYQPQIDLRTQQLVGFEALMRWHSGLLGDVPVAEFITIAEENGTLEKIGPWLKNRVCHDLKQFKQSTKRENIVVSLNSSIVEILNPKYSHNLAKALSKNGLQGEELCIEVTESVLMQDPEKVIRVLAEVQELGISISLDDFGTGYSSLQYLKDLPVSTLKIDKSFINDITQSDSRNIVESIIQLARSLQLDVLAEGAEFVEQIEILKELGCDFVQGYYFYKPLTLDKAIEEFS